MLQAHLLFPGLVPPEQRALVGAVDAVQGGDPHVLNGGIGLGAAPGVEEYRIVAPGQGDIVVPGRAHRTQVAHPFHRLEHRHHPGDAPLGGQLIDEVGLGHPQLGQGLFQVVEHNGHRAGIGQVHGAALPGEGIDIGQDGLRLRFRLLHGGNDRDGGLVRHGGGRGGGLPLSAGGQQTGRQDQGQQQGEGLFHKGASLFIQFAPGRRWGFALSSIILSPAVFCQPKQWESTKESTGKNSFLPPRAVDSGGGTCYSSFVYLR